METGHRRRGRPKGFAGAKPASTIQALDRALDVLDVLAGGDGLTLSELAGRLDQSVATMHRVLATLERRAFVEISPDTQEWHVGAEAYRLGSAFLRRHNVVERSRPTLWTLMQETGETSNLGVEKEGSVLFVSQVETHETIRAFFPPGSLSPLHASGIGKALLGTYPPDRTERLFRDRAFQRFTDKTIGSLAALREDIAATRRRGYAIDDEERTIGMRCVAAPILNFHGEAIAGISVSGPTHRLTDDTLEAIGERVRRGAATVSRLLGAELDDDGAPRRSA
ncbi:HTH-type transcriptional regulator BhcR [Methylobacterium aerolatum]|uniref:IclR family acetate operon transcriptional repressor n=1 Tax=Methylobacterium aerolatum TaxID=418708 RepID=A0ABU0I5V9_9HYPH|nr:HTH-type transcriptional regulator BhcR [Methylobacterium aerolatum]MDQ0450000.1 IclR family acetate operon transcriptional repressor [Methylobacterium aerolatum]GJD36848.1 Transcriptional repressor IclR [Methylobacterium aerolatum]